MQRPAEVLAVADSAPLLADVRAAAESLGVRVRTASSGEEALRSLLYEPDVAVVVIAVRLEGMDGLETAAAIHGRPKTRHVPILLTADVDEPDRSADAYAAGIADYLTRPLAHRELRAKLAAFAELHLQSAGSHGLAGTGLRDSLTALPTRDLFADRLQHALVRARRRPVPIAVVLADIDGFARVNDEHGRDAGDGVLLEAARRLRTLVRTGDSVARYGGDEFTILAEGVGDGDSARELGERVAEELGRPYPGGLALSVGVGVAFTTNPAGTTPDALIRRADHAMNRSRRPGAPRAEVSRVRPGLLAPTAR